MSVLGVSTTPSSAAFLAARISRPFEAGAAAAE